MFSYNNSNSQTSEWTNWRYRGTTSAPLGVQANDEVIKFNAVTYADSGNGYVPIGSFTARVVDNSGSSSSGTWNIQASGANSYITLQTATTRFANTSGSNNATIFGNGDATFKNANLGNLATANYFSGDGGYLSNIAQGNIVRTFGQVYSNASQNVAAANTATYVTFNNTGEANGVSIVSNSNVTIARTGVYNIQFSIQAVNPDNQDSTFEIWFDKNGTAIADSATQLVLQKDVTTTMTVNILANVTTANDYFRLGFAANTANSYLMAVASANTVANVASVPSVILTVTGV